MQGAGYLPNMNTKTSETAVVMRGEVRTGRIGYMSEWIRRRKRFTTDHEVDRQE